MKMTTEALTLEATGITERKGFSVNANNAKLFDILQNSMYTDKVLAPVREYMCNALDAHKMVGADRPFEVYVPNSNVPEWVVRDFGPGLSHDNVMELFTTYLLSSKDTSDDLIGGFGIGSKSAFAYTDQFVVVSFYNGVATRYAMFIDEDRMPQVAVVDKQETDEPNGLMIRVPVRKEDIGLFVQKSALIASDFPETSVEAKGFRFVPWPYTHRTDKFAISVQTNYASNAPRAYVLMGNVRYPVPAAASNKTIEALAKKNNALTLFANIGDCSLSPSREALSLDKKTAAWIQNTCDAIYDDLSKDSNAKIDAQPDLFRKARVAFQLSSTVSAFVPGYKDKCFEAYKHTEFVAGTAQKEERYPLTNNNYDLNTWWITKYIPDAMLYSSRGSEGGPPRRINTGSSHPYNWIPASTPICVAHKSGKNVAALHAAHADLKAFVIAQKPVRLLPQNAGPAAIVVPEATLKKMGIAPDFDLNRYTITSTGSKSSTAGKAYYRRGRGYNRTMVSLNEMANTCKQRDRSVLGMLESEAADTYRKLSALESFPIHYMVPDCGRFYDGYLELKPKTHLLYMKEPFVVSLADYEKHLVASITANKTKIMHAIARYEIGSIQSTSMEIMFGKTFDTTLSSFKPTQDDILNIETASPTVGAAVRDVYDTYTTTIGPDIRKVQDHLAKKPKLERLLRSLSHDPDTLRYIKPFIQGELP